MVELAGVEYIWVVHYEGEITLKLDRPMF